MSDERSAIDMVFSCLGLVLVAMIALFVLAVLGAAWRAL